MSTTKTNLLLPAIFQTETNKKFLNATLDQLVTEPNVKPINGYIGRKFSPGFKGIETYIKEPTAARADYQLEPSVIYKNEVSGVVEHAATYAELLQSISYRGGQVNNQNTLWASEYYTYDPHINLDSFINFSQYYWLPQGPPAVTVGAGTAELEKTFTVTRDSAAETYNIFGYGTLNNPDLVLVRNGTYRFEINQTGHPFYIQTDPGLSGKQISNSNLSSRQVLGVLNNGLEVGTVVFAIPDKTAQNFFQEMPAADTIDFVTTLYYSQLQGQLLSNIVNLYNGIDGQNVNLDGKLIIFGQYTNNGDNWTASSTTVPVNQRYGIWQITLTPSGADFVINLTYYADVAVNRKITVQYGLTYGNTFWYRNILDILTQFPVITADLEYLYYQDGIDASAVGRIRLVDQNNNNIDVEADILGKQNYISPNGVIFTNGLKVKFDSTVIPASYQNTEYYVEGVGTSIELIPVSNFTITTFTKTDYNPEESFTAAAVANLDYQGYKFTISTSDVPDGTTVLKGTFPNSGNPYYITDQNAEITFPFRAGQNVLGEQAAVATREAITGVTLPGIYLYGPSNRYYITNNDGFTWHYCGPTTTLNGRDSYGGAVGSSGEYYYQDSTFITANAWGNVSGFTDGYTHSDGHSKIIGFAADGYPIYGPFAYTNPLDANSAIVRMSSGYQIQSLTNRPAGATVTVSESSTGNLISVSDTIGLNPGMRITTNSAGLPVNTYYILNCANATAIGPPTFLYGDNQILLDSNITVNSGDTLTFEFLPGAFIEDYKHEGSPGVLNSMNGRYCVTPDFPNGTFAYFCTEDSSGNPVYPYIIGNNFYGSLVPESDPNLVDPDYITINRASRDINPWTRRNRWFHQAVIESASLYNNTPFSLDAASRAKRPIIEFIPNLQLYDYGTVGIAPVDIYDTTYSDPLSQVEGLVSLYIDGVKLVNGVKIVFSRADDLAVRKTVYQVELINPTNTQQIIHLVPIVTVQENNVVNVLSGLVNANKSFYYDGSIWQSGQQKTAVNQFPYFDVIDSQGYSLGNRTRYPIASNSTKFVGTKIFNYQIGNFSSDDSVLGFPLSYKSIANQGDIEFYNYFDNDKFEYISNGVAVTEKINLGYLVLNKLDNSKQKLNVWQKVSQDTKQYQILSYTYDGINNTFQTDITPEISVDVPNIKVYVNYTQLSVNDFQIYPNSTIGITVRILQSKIKTSDRIDILIYSTEKSNYGFYQVPDNLNYNSKNEILTSITLGSLRNHVQTLTQNTTKFYGAFPGNSNLRDISIVAQGGSILQQSAPVIYSGLFLNNPQYDFVNSVLTAQQEYTRFKNKFISLAGMTQFGNTLDYPAIVDSVIQQINQIKNDTFPWFYSDMIPYGENKNVIQYEILDILQKVYEITSIFSLDTPGNTAILVYLNDTQLIVGQDYTFSTTLPAIVLSDSLTVSVNDIIKIVEYYDTDGCYVPETPTKLGLYPKFVPAIYTDNTYLDPVVMIRGHDGSITPAFNDFRDQLILELEKRIFNNIKVQYDEKLINIYDVVPGNFRDTGISLNNFNSILGRYYLQWVGYNNINYVSNTTYDVGNPFTYNYFTSAATLGGIKLQGSWRAIFRYFYDTDSPHLRPWEMLGFSIKPSWWDDYYGPAPYTSGNQILWNDLERGYIAQGANQGLNEKFARPGLSAIIPTDQNGNLKPPLGLLTVDYNNNNFNANWSIGQLGPSELAWRNSSEFAFALQIALALVNPAKYFSFGINNNKYKYDTVLDQYLISDTNFRIQSDDIQLNGYIASDGTISRASGYLNWISEFNTSLGIINKQPLLDYVHNFNVQLGYRAAGFTSKEYIKVLAEQFSPNSINDSIIIPDSDFDIALHKSGPIANPRYSAIIIEKTANGFKLSGYDTKNPYFTFFNPNTEGEYEQVTILGSTAKWYTEFLDIKYAINYGTELQTLQQMASVLAGYQQFLESQGFIFSYFDENISEIRNWKLSLKELLFWIQQGWGIGSTIVLSPIADRVHFKVTNAVVDATMGNYYGSRIVNQNFLTLDTDAYSVTRLDTDYFLNLNNKNGDLIGLVDISLSQYEHLIIFNNLTQFNDVIYEPSSGARQFRLKLVGVKTADWNGTLSPNGFVYSNNQIEVWRTNTDYLRGDLVSYKNFYYTASTNIEGSTKFDFTKWLPVNKDVIREGLLRNFALNAKQFENFYDINNINLESQFDLFSLGLIGYRNRTYLDNVGLDDTSQVKLYQGFIKQKGTNSVVKTIQNINLSGEEKDVVTTEEWAFRVGSYGGLQTNQFVEINLNEDYLLSNPSSITAYTNNSVSYNSLSSVADQIYKTADIPWTPPIFLNRTNNSVYTDDIQTAGYVNIEDVDYTVYDLSNPVELTGNYNNLGTGSLIWTAIDYNRTWNVYRLSKLIDNTKVIAVTKEFDNSYLFTTDLPHFLNVDDSVIIINDLQDRQTYNGLYRITQVTGLKEFIAVNSIIDSERTFSTVDISASIYKLQSVKIDRAADLVNLDIDWKPGQKVWVNKDIADKWAVYEKSEPFISNLALSLVFYRPNWTVGSAISLSADETLLAVGAPGYENGEGAVITFIVNPDASQKENLTLGSPTSDTIGMGSSLSSGNVYMVAGASLSDNGRGYVFVYKKDFLGGITLEQILSTNITDGNFGHSLSLSKDDQWLYVGAPEADKVYAYQFNSNIVSQVDTFNADGSTSNFTINFTPYSIESLFVANVTRYLVPYKDYTLSGNVITFTSAPAAGLIAVSEYPGFTLANIISSPNANIKFGHSVASTVDGAQLVIGSPEYDYTSANTVYPNNGKVTVYDRSIERFIANGIQTTFTTQDIISNISKIYINDSIASNYTLTSSTTIQFTTAPNTGSVVAIETNAFRPITTIFPDSPQRSAKFGYSVDICNTSCSLYVGAPYQNSPINNATYSGIVNSYQNQGRIYGTITGSKLDPNVTISDSIRINDFVVTFTGSNLSSVITNINSANIPGVTAANASGYLKIVSDSVLNADKLRILPGLGTALSDLGLNVFPKTQTITSPGNDPFIFFGQQVNVGKNSNLLIVSSKEANTYNSLTFDKFAWLNSYTLPSGLTQKQLNLYISNESKERETTFDAGSTSFIDYVIGAGSSWLFTYLNNSANTITAPGKMALVQQFVPTSNQASSVLLPGAKFGSSALITNTFAYIGAEFDSSEGNKTGKIYKFINDTGLLGWDTIRNETAKVDLDSIIKAYVYSKKSNSIMVNLDYIDPAKGKILGVAEQDITYKTDYDPAIYNNGSSDLISLDTKFHWTEEQVGQVWWDLNAVRYLDYEQDSISYRNSNWANIFPGSSIDVYEWTESLYPPSQYVVNGGDGEPKYTDNSAFVTVSYVDTGTNTPVVKFYYWVKNKRNVLANLKGRTLPTLTIANYIRDPKSSGIKYFAALRDDSVAVYNLNEDLSANDRVLHIEYSNKPDSIKIHNEYQLISAAADSFDQIPSNIYRKIIDSLSRLDSNGNQVPDPYLPPQSSYGIEFRPRQSVFVNQDTAMKQLVKYVNTVFLKYVMSQGFDLTILESSDPIPVAGSGAYDDTVSTYEELTYVNAPILPTGYKILVDSDVNAGGLWTIYTKQADNSWKLTKVQTYDTAEYWQYIDWYAEGFNTSIKPTYTVQTIADLGKLTLKSEDIVKILNTGQGKWSIIQVWPTFVTTIGIQDGTIKFLDSLYALEENFMGFSNERFSVDRFDKTPSLEIRKIMQALQDSLFINQLSQEFVNLFFVLINYALNEQKSLDWVFKTSFITVNQIVKNLKQPKIYSKSDQNLYESYINEVKPFRTKIREIIESYNILDNFNGYIADFDVPSTLDPILKVYRSPSGEYVQDSDLFKEPQYVDWLYNYKYFVNSVTVENPGSGYTVAPEITVGGSLINDNARLRAILSNGAIARVEVVYPGSNYVTQPIITVSGGNGSGAILYANLTNTLVRKLKTILKYDRVTYGSNILEWTANTSYSQGNVVAYNNNAYTVIRNFVSTALFDSANLKLLSPNSLSTANDRIQSYYTAEAGSLGKDYSLLQSGIEYPGVTVEGFAYNESGGFDIANFDINTFDPVFYDAEGTPSIPDELYDTKIQSLYTDTTLGSAAGDIIVDGHTYVSTYSSHAPEELVPGRIFDTLDLKVQTFSTNAAQASYSNWISNTGFYLDEIVIVNGGSGYSAANVAVVISGTTGSSAAANVTLDANGKITAVTLTNVGIAYSTIPNVTVTGGNITAAVLSARLTQNTYNNFEYRIFKDKNDNYQYLRIAENATTLLASNLSLTANSLIVANSRVLPMPDSSSNNICSVTINGERIVYFEKNDTTNTLSRLIRGAYGTGANIHYINAAVIDSSFTEIVPKSSNYTFTPNANTVITTAGGANITFAGNATYIRSNVWTEIGSNTGLYTSDTTEAIFVRQN